VIEVSALALQDGSEAKALAQRVVDELAEPRTRLPKVEVFADPRRQPGDVVTVTDPKTGLSGSFWLTDVSHARDGARYTQTLGMRAIGQTGVVVSAGEVEGLANPPAFIVGVNVVASNT
jgi:hypothetical protein